MRMVYGTEHRALDNDTRDMSHVTG